MKKLLFLPIIITLASCGSSWDITGNTLNIQKAFTDDTVIPKGSIYITPDSLTEFKLEDNE